MTYSGLEVLNLTQHRPGPIEETIARTRVTLRPVGGVAAVIPRTVTAAGATTYHFEGLNRTQVAELRAFVDLHCGALKPFWVPSYEADLTLAADAASGATSLSVVDNGYAANLWPGTGARRHLALYRPDLALVLTKVSAASGGTLTVTPGLSAARPATSTVSFLRLVRMVDVLEIEWRSCHVAAAELAVVELPAEAPL